MGRDGTLGHIGLPRSTISECTCKFIEMGRLPLGFMLGSSKHALAIHFHSVPYSGLVTASAGELRDMNVFLPSSLLSYTEQYLDYDPFFVPPDPSNPWLSDDTTFWELEAR